MFTAETTAESQKARRYTLLLQADPDHIPEKGFLEYLTGQFFDASLQSASFPLGFCTAPHFTLQFPFQVPHLNKRFNFSPHAGNKAVPQVPGGEGTEE